MRTLRAWLLAVIAAHGLPAGAASDPPGDPAGTDPDSGLIIAPGWELVRAHCGACHSYRLVTAQRGDRAFWLEAIRWMQRTQNLWELPADQESAILDYLAGAYAETDWGRRPPLPPGLMPRMPPAMTSAEP